VGIMTIRAVPLRPRMLKLRRFNPCNLIGMTASAKSFNTFLREHNFAILGWLMAHIAKLLSEGRMYESLHELWPIGLVRVVATNAVGFSEGLPLMRFDQGRVCSIVAIEAKRRGCFRQVKGKLRSRPVPASMSCVASITA